MPISNPTPYSLKADKSFWKTAVAQTQLGTEPFADIHKLIFPKQTIRLASMGSCFAQHVGKWLLEGGFNFKQSQLETEQVSSFAFGNIYTPKSFLQWLDIAEQSADFTIGSAIALEHGRYFDLLRPNFNIDGYETTEALITARRAASAEMIATIKQTDVLIFTLGLIEAWQDNANVIYPVCPGVISGSFDAENHQIHEFTYDEIKQDVIAIYQRLRKINPELRLLLTVSPVPLTATATDKHILVASQYAKSVLRAVAGYLSDHHEHIDYFPSYEIITAPNKGDFRFESNLRSVTPEGVGYVMSHFKSAFIETDIDTESLKHENKSEPVAMPAVNLVGEVVCEEELLGAVSKLNDEEAKGSLLDKPKSLVLLGDSHLNKLSTAFTHLGVEHCGGMVMHGSGFAQRKFALCDTEYFVPLESALSRQLWRPILANLQASEQLGTDAKSTIITNIGLQTHQSASRFYQWMHHQESKDVNNIQLEDYVDYFDADQSDQFSILFNLKDAGHNLILVFDPPFSKHVAQASSMTDLIFGYFNALEYVWKQLGVTTFNAAAEFEAQGLDPEQFKSNVCDDDGFDWIHGNDNYYAWLASELMRYFEPEFK